MNKMVINHLEKLFVTSDASTIVTELDVNHPAAKLLVMAAKAQAAEVGDGTNLVSFLVVWSACCHVCCVRCCDPHRAEVAGAAAELWVLQSSWRLFLCVRAAPVSTRAAAAAAPLPLKNPHSHNQVLSLAGELLGNAEGLLREGLHTAEIADGYHKALEKVRAASARHAPLHSTQ